MSSVDGAADNVPCEAGPLDAVKPSQPIPNDAVKTAPAEMSVAPREAKVKEASVTLAAEENVKSSELDGRHGRDEEPPLLAMPSLAHAADATRWMGRSEDTVDAFGRSFTLWGMPIAHWRLPPG